MSEDTKITKLVENVIPMQESLTSHHLERAMLEPDYTRSLSTTAYAQQLEVFSSSQGQTQVARETTTTAPAPTSNPKQGS